MSNATDMAFPALDVQQTPNNSIQLGLTKREYFAAMVMQGMCTGTPWIQTNDGFEISRRSVAIADALLAELAK